MFDFRDFINTAIDKVQRTPLLFSIVSSPFYVALVITTIAIVIFIIVFYDGDAAGTSKKKTKGSLWNKVLKGGFWIFFMTTGVIFLYSSLIQRREVIGSADFDPFESDGANSFESVGANSFRLPDYESQNIDFGQIASLEPRRPVAGTNYITPDRESRVSDGREAPFRAVSDREAPFRAVSDRESTTFESGDPNLLYFENATTS